MPFSTQLTTGTANTNQFKVTVDQFQKKDSTGNLVNLKFITGKYPPKDHTQPRLDLTTKSLLYAVSSDGRKKHLWEAVVTSEVNNTEDDVPLPHRPAMGFNSRVLHPMSDGFIALMNQKAFEHHEDHKTEFVLNLAGSSVDDLANILKD